MSQTISKRKGAPRGAGDKKSNWDADKAKIKIDFGLQKRITQQVSCD
jgi:hypothetical protein